MPAAHKAESRVLNIKIEYLCCQTIVDGHSCYVQPVCIGNGSQSRLMGFGVPNRVAGVFDLGVCSGFPNALFCIWRSDSIAHFVGLIV